MAMRWGGTRWVRIQEMGGDLRGQQVAWAQGLWGSGGHYVKDDPNKAIRSEQCMPVYSNCSTHINISNNSQNIQFNRTMYKLIIIRLT